MTRLNPGCAPDAIQAMIEREKGRGGRPGAELV